MAVKDTLLSMLRPSSMGKEVEERGKSKVENKVYENSEPTASSKKRDMPYKGVNYDFLNSNIFINESNQMKVCVPTDFEDTEIITEAIKANKIILLMLDNLDSGLDQRVLDMVTGVCAAYNIAIEEIPGRKMYIVDPLHKRLQRSR